MSQDGRGNAAAGLQCDELGLLRWRRSPVLQLWDLSLNPIKGTERVPLADAVRLVVTSLPNRLPAFCSRVRLHSIFRTS
jgi:hypothetical protein